MTSVSGSTFQEEFDHVNDPMLSAAAMKPGHRIGERFVLLYHPFRLAVRADREFTARSAIRSAYTNLLSHVLSYHPSMYVSETTGEVFFVFPFLATPSLAKQPSTFPRIVKSLVSLHHAQLDAFPQAVPAGLMNFVSPTSTSLAANISSLEVLAEFETLCDLAVGKDAVCAVPESLKRLLERLFTREPQEIFCNVVKTGNRIQEFQDICGEEAALEQLVQRRVYLEPLEAGVAAISGVPREFPGMKTTEVFGRFVELSGDGNFQVVKFESSLFAVIGHESTTKEQAWKFVKEKFPGLTSMVTMLLTIREQKGMFFFSPAPNNAKSGNLRLVLDELIAVYSAALMAAVGGGGAATMKGASAFPGMDKMNLLDRWLLRDGPLKDLHLGGLPGSILLDSLQICQGRSGVDPEIFASLRPILHEAFLALNGESRDFCHIVQILDFEMKLSDERKSCWRAILRPILEIDAICDATLQVATTFQVDEPVVTSVGSSSQRATSPSQLRFSPWFMTNDRASPPTLTSMAASPRASGAASPGMAMFGSPGRRGRSMSGLADVVSRKFEDVVLLGVGQYGRVYRATMQTEVRRDGEVIRDERVELAVKVSNGFLTSLAWKHAASAVDPFMNEVKMMKLAEKEELDFIPRNLGSVNGHRGYLMTYFHGKSLLAGVECTPQEISDITRKVGENAIDLWSRNILHGDLNGGNVLVNHRKNVMFIDLDKTEKFELPLIRPHPTIPGQNIYHDQLLDEVDNLVNSMLDSKFRISDEDESEVACVREYVDQLRQQINGRYVDLSVTPCYEDDD